MTEDFKTLLLFYCMNAPEWANYAAVDKDGHIFVYQSQPCALDEDINSYLWQYSESSISAAVGTMDMTDIDWTKTLVELL